MMRVRTISIAVLLTLATMAAQASWYDDYDAGIAAANKGQWQVVVQKMTAALAGNGKENDKARTYGAIFINYHPHYYRGVAYLNLGQYQKAIDDFDAATGAGEKDFGSIEALHQRAQQKLDAASTPEPAPAPVPVPVPQPVRPTPVPVPAPQPAAPTMDPGLRQRALASINTAKGRLSAAQQRKATASPQYTQAVQAIADANTRVASARTNDDLNAAITVAENATLYADAAQAIAAPAPATATIPLTRPAAATDAVLRDSQRRVRQALEMYFRGDFDEAATSFASLTRDMPTNGWIWAFLGASQYSRYAFEADEQYKSAAMESFRKAKRYGGFKSGLPEKYFSRRIRRVFDNAG